MNHIEAKFSPISDEARSELADLRSFVSGLVVRFLPGCDLLQTAEDFGTLQQLRDVDAMRDANYGAWVAIGVAFGDALINFIPGLAWCMESDQFGTNAALRFRQSGLSIAVLSIFWKRVERGEAIDVRHIANELSTIVANHDAQPIAAANSCADC